MGTGCFRFFWVLRQVGFHVNIVEKGWMKGGELLETAFSFGNFARLLFPLLQGFSGWFFTLGTVGIS